MFAEGFEEDEGGGISDAELAAMLSQQTSSTAPAARHASDLGASTSRLAYTPYAGPSMMFPSATSSSSTGSSSFTSAAALMRNGGQQQQASTSTSTSRSFDTPIVTASNARAPNPSSSGLSLASEGAGFFRPYSATTTSTPTPTTYDIPVGGNDIQVSQDNDDDDIVIESAKPASASHRSSVATSSTSAYRHDSKGKQKDVIDLTAQDSDDEVIIDDHPVCIGEIQTLALILYSVAELQAPPPQLDRNGKPLPQPSTLPSLPVYIYRDVKQGHQESLRLITPRRKDVFGVVEQRMANVIGPLLGDGYSGTGITKEPRRAWCEALIHRRTERNPLMLQLTLLFFCPTSAMQAVADHLEANAIFLQHPATYSPSRHHGAPYKNPHNPAEGTGASGERKRQNMLNSLYSSVGNAQRTVKASDVQKQQVEAVFQELKSGVDLEETEPSPLVTARLYPHQKQALSFLLDRESLVHIPPPDPVSHPPNTVVFPWQARYDMYKRRIGWKCLITDQQLTGPDPPPQARGAILADDMGLGKTLVVISLVCATLDEASSWAQEPVTREDFDKRLEQSTSRKKAGASATPNGSQQQQSQQGTGDVNLRDFGNVFGLDQTRIADSSSSTYAVGMSPVANMSKKKKDAKAKREKKKEEMIAARFAKLVCRSKATLIVCPLSTVQNWESQFEEHTTPASDLPHSFKMDFPLPSHTHGNGDDDDFKPDARDSQTQNHRAFFESLGMVGTDKRRKLSIYVYHGASRSSDAREIAKHDVVITTYSTVATEFSKQVKAEEKKEDEEEAAAEKAKNAEEGFEIVDPAAKEDSTRFKPKKRARATQNARKDDAYVSPLQEIQWFRIVLDEAHIIKEHTTVQARAACELSASRRVVLSGTPLQNSLNDLFSLIRFLRLEPFIDRAVWTQYIGNPAKTGDPLGVSRLQLLMRHLALRRTKDTKDKEGKPILELPPNDQALVELPFDETERAFYTSHHQRYKHEFAKLEETDSVMRNYVSILQELLRLRQICVHMALVRDSEDKEGGDVVETIKAKGLSKPRALELLTLIRDSGEGKCAECGYDLLPAAPVVNEADEAMGDEDGRPQKRQKKGKSKAVQIVKAECSSAGPSSTNASRDNTDDDEQQPFKVPTDPTIVLTRCMHVICPRCVDHRMRPGFMEEGVKPDEMVECSVCRTALNGTLDLFSVRRSEVEQASEQAAEAADATKTRRSRTLEHSTKMRALLADVIPFSQANPASVNFTASRDEQAATIGFQPVTGEVVKSVVFSQWTTLLDRIGDELDAVNIKYRRLDGTMTRDKRSEAMAAFKNDPGVEILLVSLRAGGVGLNLTAGRRVYLMEPFWNPAVENQAVDRIHRLGQTMPVQTVRFVIEKSIEMNMLKIQKRKMELANMSLSQTLSKAELAKRRMDDIKTLLS